MKSALDSLNEAKKRGQEKNFGSDEAVGEDASDAASKLEDSKRALEDAMDKLEQARRERGGKNFDDAADSESKAAERADDLKKRGQDGDAALPKAMLDRLERAKQAMRDAERLLRERKFDEAREKQEEAQRLLEMARDDDAPPPNDPREDGDGTVQSGPTAVPGEDAHKNPDEFRRRVLEGLAKPGEARLHDAIKRYAEGLLK
ncbi:MAG: hypothetical protein U0271_06225 [Polyangiaceae bacterium]